MLYSLYRVINLNMDRTQVYNRSTGVKESYQNLC